MYTPMSAGRRFFRECADGNIVLLGINVADGNWEKLSGYTWPILAFMVGILVAGACETGIPA